MTDDLAYEADREARAEAAEHAEFCPDPPDTTDTPPYVPSLDEPDAEMVGVSPEATIGAAVLRLGELGWSVTFYDWSARADAGDEWLPRFCASAYHEGAHKTALGSAGTIMEAAAKVAAVAEQIAQEAAR